MKLSSLLAIAGGVVGLATGTGLSSQIASGAAIVSGVAGLTGNSNVAKIAAIASLGAGAYSIFGGDSSASTDTAAPAASGIDASLAGDRGNAAISDNASASPSWDEALNKSAGPMQAGMAGDPSPVNVDPLQAVNAPAAVTPPPTIAAPQPVQTGASSPAPQGLFDMVKSGANNVGDWIEKNKEVSKLGFGALNGMYGPQAKQVSIMEARLKQQQDQIDRQNANTNNLTGLQLGVTTNPAAVVKRTGMP